MVRVAFSASVEIFEYFNAVHSRHLLMCLLHVPVEVGDGGEGFLAQVAAGLAPVQAEMVLHRLFVREPLVAQLTGKQALAAAAPPTF